MEKSGCTKIFYVFLSLLVVSDILQAEASFLNWIWPNRNVFPAENNDFFADPPAGIQFELADLNDKFIRETSKVLGTKLSHLDFCQQRVILSLQKSCNTLNDEELEKLAVSLLNCQLSAESRETYECGEKVSLQACVENMPPDIRQIYNLVVDRCLETCLATRQQHFRGYTEMTVNKIFASVQGQLKSMNNLKESQELIERAILGSLDEITRSHLQLLQKQHDVLQLVEVQRHNAERNTKEILIGKKLLASTNEKLSTMFSKLQLDIDVIASGTEKHSDFATKLLDDLANLQKVSANISELIKQSDDRFNSTLVKLQTIDQLVSDISEYLLYIRAEYGQSIQWLRYYVDNANSLRRTALILIHVMVLLVGMVFMLFIEANILIRIAFLFCIFLHLTAVVFFLMPFSLQQLLVSIAASSLAMSTYIYMKKRSQLIQKSAAAAAAVTKKIPSYSSHQNEPSYSATPFKPSLSTIPFSNANFERRNSLSSNGSEHSNRTYSSDGGRCSATTLRGTPCHNSQSLNGLCHIHQRSTRERSVLNSRIR